MKCSLLTETNTNHIKRAINESPLDRSLANLDINNKVYLFNEKINILSNFFPHETITLDDIDPTWINSKVEHLVNGINDACKEKKKFSSNFISKRQSKIIKTSQKMPLLTMPFLTIRQRYKNLVNHRYKNLVKIKH